MQIQHDLPLHLQHLEHISAKVLCHSCEKNINQFIQVIDQKNQLIYCTSCFCKLQSFPQTYSVQNTLNYPIYNDNWTAQQELLLLDGLERCGFGNWKQIARFIGNKKSDTQIQEHYNNTYITDKFMQVIITQQNCPVLVTRNQNNILVNKKTGCPCQYANVQRNKDKSQPYLNTSNHTERSIPCYQNSTIGEMIGYMPLRGDFDNDYDCNAELIISQLEFCDDDSKEFIELKQNLLKIYYRRLQQRYIRKDFVINRKLYDQNKYKEFEKHHSKEEVEIYNKLKPFARFSNVQKHEQFIKRIIKLKQLQKKIMELKYYKKLGYNNFEQIQKSFCQKKNNSLICNKKNQFDKYRTTRNNMDKRSNQLDHEEEKLCQELKLRRDQYQSLKESILKEYIERGYLEKQTVDLERKVGAKIFNLLVKKRQVNIYNA